MERGTKPRSRNGLNSFPLSAQEKEDLLSNPSAGNKKMKRGHLATVFRFTSGTRFKSIAEATPLGNEDGSNGICIPSCRVPIDYSVSCRCDRVFMQFATEPLMNIEDRV